MEADNPATEYSEEPKNFAGIWKKTEPEEDNKIKPADLPHFQTAAVSLTSIRSRRYAIETSIDLTEWTAVGEPISGTGFSITSSDTDQNAVQRFYRIRFLE